jgi:hypothetical protein
MGGRPLRYTVASTQLTRRQARLQSLLRSKRKLLLEPLEDRSLMAVVITNPSFEDNANLFVQVPVTCPPQVRLTPPPSQAGRIRAAISASTLAWGPVVPF